MNKSDSIAKLSEALSRAQGELKPAPLNSTNPFLKNRYADLGSVIEAARPVLARHGLSVTQLVNGDGERIGVETVLAHATGEWISETVSLALSDEKGKSGAQVAGSIITYLRRYALAAILGMYADEDNDVHKAEGGRPAQAQASTNGNGHKPGPSRQQLLAAFDHRKAEAETYGIEVLPLADDATAETIIERGKNLASMIAARKGAVHA